MAAFLKNKKAKVPAPETAETVAGSAAGVIPHHVVLGVLRHPHASEKAHTLAATMNQYTFVVHDDANKRLVREAIESQYKVTVLSVNIVHEPGKMKRWRNTTGRRPGIKKAIVTVKAGDKIETV
jgi:large subunit ribosomal protein L23